MRKRYTLLLQCQFAFVSGVKCLALSRAPCLRSTYYGTKNYAQSNPNGDVIKRCPKGCSEHHAETNKFSAHVVLLGLPLSIRSGPSRAQTT